MQRAQGNAFYVEELVSAFLGGGWSLPEDLADLLLVRLDRLDESAPRRGPGGLGRRPAGAARPARPRRARSPRTSSRSPCAPPSTPTSWSAPDDAEYAFRHALLGEAVYDDLLPGERMRLHTAYAEAVRELHGSRGAADLARHALASHDLPTALQASVEAGEQALASGGPDEAARHFTKALEIYDRAAGHLDDPPDEAELVARTVDALCGSGRPETALSLVDSHLGSAARRRAAALPRPAAARPRRGAALDRDRRPAEPGHGRGARAGRPRTHPAARADPRDARHRH